MSTHHEQNSKSIKKGTVLSFALNLAFTILMLLGTSACLIFDGPGNTVTKGTMGMVLGTIGCMLGTCFSYVDYRMARPAPRA